MTRKTINYYREALNNKPSIITLKEIVKKYVCKNEIKLDVEFVWNHQLKELYISKSGELQFDVYWQGDSTDGHNSVLVADVIRGRGFIPAEHVLFDNHTYEVHGDINVRMDEHDAVIKYLKKYLEPNAIKERKERRIKSDMMNKASALFSKMLKDNVFSNTAAFWTTREKVLNHIYDNAKEMRTIPDDKLENYIIDLFTECRKD